MLSPIPLVVEKLLLPRQLEHTTKYLGVYAEAVGNLNGARREMLVT